MFTDDPYTYYVIRAANCPTMLHFRRKVKVLFQKIITPNEGTLLYILIYFVLFIEITHFAKSWLINLPIGKIKQLIHHVISESSYLMTLPN